MKGTRNEEIAKSLPNAPMPLRCAGTKLHLQKSPECCIFRGYTCFEQLRNKIIKE